MMSMPAMTAALTGGPTDKLEHPSQQTQLKITLDQRWHALQVRKFMSGLNVSPPNSG